MQLAATHAAALVRALLTYACVAGCFVLQVVAFWFVPETGR